MTVGLLALLLACGPAEDTGRKAPTGGGTVTGTLPTGSTSGGTPTGTTPTTPPGPVWTEVFQDDVWVGGTDLHHPTHTRMPDGRTAIFWDAELVSGEHVVLARGYRPDHTSFDEPQQADVVDGSFGRPDGGALPPAAPLDAGYAVTWHTAHDVFVGRLTPDGVKLATVKLNESPGVDSDRGQPDLAVLGDGTIATVYHLSDLGAAPVSRYYVRHLSADLATLGPETEIATSDEVGSPPDILALPAGGYVVAWSTRTPTNGTVELTWFDDAGVAQQTVRADQSPVDETPSRPNLAVQPDGTLGVTWRVQTNDGTPLGAYGRIFAADGSPLTTAFLLEAGGQRPGIAAGPGFFLYAWEPLGSDRLVALAVDATTGVALETPWEPFGGTQIQHRPQASFYEKQGGDWEVLFTMDRGAVGGRSLGRAVYEVALP